MAKRSLYQCSNARVKGKEIYCKMGRDLSAVSISGNIGIGQLISGNPMEITICQDCLYYDEMGPPIPRNEMGRRNGKKGGYRNNGNTR